MLKCLLIILMRYKGARSLVPDYGDFIIKKDICGNKTKWYTFGFIAIESLDTYDTDVNNSNIRQAIDEFNDWLVTQASELKELGIEEKATIDAIMNLYGVGINTAKEELVVSSWPYTNYRLIRHYTLLIQGSQ